MNVFVNAQSQEVPQGTTIDALVQSLGIDRRKIAVECNGQIVPRAQHPVTVLAEGDRVEIVTMVGGG